MENNAAASSSKVTPPHSWQPTPWVLKYSAFISRNSAVILLVTFITVSILGYLAIDAGFDINSSAETFVVRFGELSNNHDAIELGSRDSLFDPIGAAATTSQPQQSSPSFNIYILADHLMHDGETIENENMLIADVVKTFKAIEIAVTEVSDYDKYCAITPPSLECDSPITITNLAYPTLIPFGNTTIENPDGKGNFTSDFEASVVTPLATNPAYADLASGLLHKDFDADNRESALLLSVFSFGLPLEGYTSVFDREEEQAGIVVDWLYETMAPVLQDMERNETYGFHLLYMGDGATNFDIDNIIGKDALWALGSTLFVAVYVLFHTGSCFITTLGMTHVLMSFPLALFFFNVVFQIGYFSVLNFLAVFVILGIGADDIFVMLDAWKQAGWINDGDVAHPVSRRLAFTLTRSIKAMTLTSISTAVAFAANLASSVVPIRLFGLWATLLVFFNFALICFWFPSVICLHERYLRYGVSSLFCVSRSKAKASAHPSMYRNTSVTSVGPAEITRKPRRIEMFCAGPWADFVEKHAKIILVVLIACAGVGAYFMTQFTPSSDLVLLPDSVPAQRMFTLNDNDIKSAPFVVKMMVMFGVEGIDRSALDQGDPDSLGEVVRQDDLTKFNPDMTVEAQEFLIFLCDELLDYSEEVTAVTCPVRALHEWRNESGIVPNIPDPGDFQQAMKDFAFNFTGGAPPVESRGDFAPGVVDGLKDSVGFNEDTGDLWWLRIILSVPDYRWLQDEREDIRAYFDERMEDAPDGLSQAIISAFPWQDSATEANMATTAYSSIALSLVACFFIVLYSTGSVRMTVFTLLTVVCVVVVSIGWLAMIGYSLTIVESICMTIIVGVSLDYVVHFSHAANEAKGTRGQRMRSALGDMGISVLSSGITTFGSSLFLFGATVVLFTHFGVFLSVTIASSLLYSSTFFFALFSLWGPHSDSEASSTPATKISAIAPSVSEPAESTADHPPDHPPPPASEQ